MTSQENRLSLYVHWPFCEAKCPYCDFNSHVREKVDVSRYGKALLTELGFFSELIKGQHLTSIFFGGGTPSLMPPEIVAAVIEKAKDRWDVTPDIEITLEANPGSSEAKKFRDFHRAGVNRLSLGVQAFRDDALKFLGRVHNAGEALAAIQMARDTFPRFSFDLIYARPGQSQEAWREELEQGLSLVGGHLSLYQLTLEKDTAFYRQHRRGRLHLPPEDQAVALYTLTNDMCEAAGLPAYEISNYARPGQESRHNLNTWRGGAYAGIGPGAHSRIYRQGAWQALSTIKMPEAWLARVEEAGAGINETVSLTPAERAEEVVMTALRLRTGLAKKTFKKITGVIFARALNQNSLRFLKDKNLLFETETHFGTTPKGALVLDSVLAELLV